MKRAFSSRFRRTAQTFALALTLTSTLASVAMANPSAPPNISTPATSNVGANQVTLTLTSSATGTGYFTLLAGSGTSCGTGTQVKAGTDAGDTTAPYHGSLPLTTATPGAYTVHNLIQSTPYTVCFTADNTGELGLQATPTTANVTTNATATYLNPGWVNVANSGLGDNSGTNNVLAANNVLAFAPDGTPFLSYKDLNPGYGILKTFNGTVWNDVTGADYYGGGDIMQCTTVAFAPDGTLYQAFVSNNGGTLNVRKFKGGSWSTVGDTISGSINNIFLAIAPDGTPYVSFTDANNFGVVAVKKFNSTWVSVGTLTSNADYTSLAFAQEGTPYLSYRDTTNAYNTVSVQKLVTGSWETAGSSFVTDSNTSDPVSVSNLVFAPDGTPYVAYGDGDQQYFATVKKLVGSAWELVGTAGGASDVSIDSNTNLKLAIGPDGAPYLMYQDQGADYKVTVKKFTGGSWQNVGAPTFTTRANDISMAFAPDGTPSVAYTDNVSGLPKVMKIGTGSSPSLAGVVTYHSGNIHSTLKSWTLLVTNKNSATGAATNTVLDSMSLTQTFPGGTPCTPVIGALPTIGALAIGHSMNTAVKINFAGCASNARFTSTFNFKDGGFAVGTSTIYNQVQ